jgi:TP901 family phage tail tape measure protein
MADIKTGVILSLKDLLSQGMHKAAGAASGFADKTLGAVEKIDKALSGTAAKLAAFGLTLSVGAAAKGIIELDHRMTRLGLTANASAEQVAKIKQSIFDIAQSQDVKVDPTEILAGLEVVMEKVGDIKFVEENIKNLGLAIQATGEGGAPIGDILSEFAKFGYTAQDVTKLMDDLVAQGDQGAFTFAEFAKNAPAVFSAYSAIGNTPEHMKKANAAMQILVAGTKSSDVAVTALNSTMNELADPEKQKKLRQLGISVRDSGGNFRDFNDIMFDIVNKAKEMGNADFFGTIFGSVSMQAVRSYMTQGERMYAGLIDLGDTAGTLQGKSAVMAKTLQSNITNLQTAFGNFADSNLTKPLEHLTGLLNKLAEDPERLKKVFTGIAVGIGAIAAVKGIAGISRLVGSLAQLKGGRINIAESLNMAQAMPVYVTNWGGGAGIPGLGGLGSGGPAQQAQLAKGNPLVNAQNAVGNITPGQYATGATVAGIGAAFVAIPNMINELEEIKQNEELTDKERGRAKGGAIGAAGGSIAGAAAGGAAGIAAGAAAGAAVGSVVPVLGTAVGALVGAGIGALGMWLGGKAGRAIGEGIGGALADDGSKRTAAPFQPSPYTFGIGLPSYALPAQITRPGTGGIAPVKAELEGRAVMDVNVNLSGERPAARVLVRNNSIYNMRFNTGNAFQARMVP